MEHVDVVFTSYMSNGRCMVMENFISPWSASSLCGQVATIKNSAVNRRGHKGAKNSTWATSHPGSAAAGQDTMEKGQPLYVES